MRNADSWKIQEFKSSRIAKPALRIPDCEFRIRNSAFGIPHSAFRIRGAALIVCIFAMVIVSSMVVLALDVATTEMSITRNTMDLSKALYVADAGIQHALAMLRSDRTWRDGFPSPGVEFPAGSGSGYVLTVAEGAGGEVIVTATGTAGSLSKTVRATITVAP